MYKNILIFCVLARMTSLSIWYLLNTEENSISYNDRIEAINQKEKLNDVIIIDDFIESEKVVSKIDTSQSEEIIQQYSEVTFEEILYPEEYDFKSVDAGKVYEKAGTKIKADFSYMMDKKIGDEVTVHFLNESLSGIIVKVDKSNGPNNIRRFDYLIDINNSVWQYGSLPESINLSISEQNNIIYRTTGNFKTFHSNGMFILKNGIGYFTTKEDYGKIAKDVIKYD